VLQIEVQGGASVPIEPLPRCIENAERVTGVVTQEERPSQRSLGIREY